LTTEPIPELVRRIAIPASIGYFFNTMYNVVDTYFAGLISTQALASLSLSLPVFFIIIATGTGVSTGATALIANALGAGKREEARLYAAQAISFGILTALALTVFGLLVSPFLFRVLGAEGEYLSMVLDYMNTLFLGDRPLPSSLHVQRHPERPGGNQTLSKYPDRGFLSQHRA
jgi:Na+-driven multidrug efflux pump